MYRIFKLAAAAVLTGAALNPLGAQTQKTITFGSSKPSGFKNSKGRSHHSSDYGKNTLTVGVLSYLDGFTALSYERMLTESITVSAGAGITHKNLWMQIGDELFERNPGAGSDNHSGNRGDIADKYGSFAHRTPQMGLYMCVSPKFYPRHESLDGTYVAPLIEYRNYRWNAQKADESPFQQAYYLDTQDDQVPRTSETVSESVRCLDISVILGGHYQLGGHIVLGYHAGFGLRNIQASRLDLGYEQIQDHTYRYTNDMVRYSDSRWMVNMGFSIGGWW